jgi:hypothetical protein
MDAIVNRERVKSQYIRYLHNQIGARVFYVYPAHMLARGSLGFRLGNFIKNRERCNPYDGLGAEIFALRKIRTKYSGDTEQSSSFSPGYVRIVMV